jgi:hypothetical protein
MGTLRDERYVETTQPGHAGAPQASKYLHARAVVKGLWFLLDWANRINRLYKQAQY